MERKYAQVIIYGRSKSTDKPYTYLIDSNMAEVLEEGMRVLIPFGIGNKIIKGIIIRIQDDYDEEYKLKRIIDTIDDKPLISRELIDLSLWMSRKYLSPYLSAFQAILPPGDFKEVKTVISLKKIKKEDYNNLNSSEKELYKIIDTEKGSMELEYLKTLVDGKITNMDIRKLEEKGILETSLEVRTSIKKKYEKYIGIKDRTIDYDEMLNIIGKRSYKQLEIAKYLWIVETESMKELLASTDSSYSTIKALEKKGFIDIFEKEIYRTPIGKDIRAYKKHQLSSEQRHCVDYILSIRHADKGYNEFLIHGVTGSGKTEIYLQLVEEMIREEKESIVLVPEIALTPQTINRFVGRFGNNVAVLHSKLSFGERFDQWRKIKEGKVKIAIGARSAVFAPFNNLGLIIIDEEHETSYKSTMNPKYNAIEVAEQRCKKSNAVLLKGSATPSIESYYRCKNGITKLYSLKKRIGDKELPDITIVDMREELSTGNKSMFSKELYNAIDLNLKAGRQTILFLNRRGYSTFVSCRQCGYVVKCSECSISMTYHFKDNNLKCHYCGRLARPPLICPVCKSKYIKYFGIGTEKVERYTKEMFPEAIVKRMDLDTTSRKGSHELIFNEMKDEEIDILIGTQMVAKGLDFKNVTLVGIIAADTTLNLPDFRSSERTFQLITQVAGRAGRGEYEGKVIAQTYTPEHYSIQHSRNHDYTSFYDEEILLRKEFNYPPFVNIITILAYGTNKEHTAKIIKKVYDALIRHIERKGIKGIKEGIAGPFPAPLERIKNNYRYQIIIKAKDDDMELLKELIEWVCIDNKTELDLTGVRFSIDINPNSML